MLSHVWVLTILAPLAFGVPIPRESVTPSVRLSDSKSDTETLNGSNKLGLNHADKAIWNLKGHEDKAGSKTSLIDKGSPSLGGHSAHGTGISYNDSSVLNGKKSSSTSEHVSGTHPLGSLSTGISGGTSGGTPGGRTGTSRQSDKTSGGSSSDGGASKEPKDGKSYGGHGEHGEHGSGTKRGRIHEQLESHGSGSTSGSASKTGSEGMTTSNDGVATGSEDTTGTRTTTSSESTVSGTTPGGKGTTGSEGTTNRDGITASASKLK